MIWRDGCARDGCMAVTGRRGFTLMEMLIASVLTATLMAMIWSMLSMYGSYLTAGRQQAADRQLRRSIVQLLREDLQRA
ncbi:MAG: PulJ/GspJ family protein, partial [Planctomycetaceae bacterium]